ncbi:MAG: carboxypeptidase-like regulatory domain-containing protein, partial [Bacteroidales bacterium]|nr:carboxypeptidase-like regulatory domain-containing protein [Bacteroidales bacterium]
MKTFFLKAVCITIMLHSAFGLFAQRDIFPKQVKEETTIIKEKIVSASFGKAPLSADRKAYTDKPFNYLKGEYSEALICISEDLGHFIISNPEVYESYGVTIPEFINSGEYYQGLYYYASSTSGLFGTIDPSSGTISQLASGCPFGSVAYNPIDDQMYGISLGNAPVLYTVNTSNGAATQTTTCEGGYILGLTIDNDGRFFIIDTDIDGLCEINPATGAVISIWPADFTVNYGQDVSCDRETNTIYWAAYNADAGCSQLYSFDPMGGYTLIGAFSNQASCFAIKTVKNLNAASAPTNLTITPDPYEGLSATLSWTNPTTTIGGAPLSSIQNIIVKRDGVIIQEYNNPGVGANMTYVNVVPTSGTYVYTVYAVTSEGDGISAGGSANVGEFCTFIVYGHDSFGDGWNMAAINFDGTDGSTLGTFTVTSSETTKLFTIPKGTIINCVWIAGIYDSEVDVINITTLSGSTIFSSNSAPAAGIFHTFANNCTLTIPNAPTDFAVIENPDNNLSAILSWTNPSTCKDGSILNMISATVMRNGEIIHSINNPVNGANETFTDNTIPEAGCYIYIVYVTNSEGISDLATETVYIGIYPMQYCETVEISTCSGIVLDNGAYNNYLNNSNDIMIIHSSSPGACVVLSGPYSIETGHDKLRIYDGTGTNGTLLNTYSNSAGGIVEEVSSATTGSLTLHFTSDGNVRRSGFELTIACAERVPVSGNVTVASSGAPIAGANISFNGIGGTSVTTDSYGNYSISLIPDTFDIIVEAVGYNTIVETGFVIPESGINNKNFVMTTPTIAVNPTSVSMSCGYMG